MSLIEDERPPLPEKVVPYYEKSERSQYRLVTWHLDDYHPAYMIDDGGTVPLWSADSLLEYILKAGFCYSPAAPQHLECLLKLLGPKAVELARNGRVTYWSAFEGPYYLTYWRTKASAKLSVSCGNRHGGIGLIEWLLPARAEKVYGTLGRMPDAIELDSVDRVLRKIHHKLQEDFYASYPDLTAPGALIGSLMEREAPWLFGLDFGLQNDFNQLVGGGDAETISFGGENLLDKGWDKRFAVGSKIVELPRYAKVVRSRQPPEEAIHGVVVCHLHLNTSLSRSPIVTRKIIRDKQRLIDAVGSIIKVCSLDDIRLLDEHPEWGKYDVLEEGKWLVPIRSSRAFEKLERVLFEYTKDPDLRRFAKALGFASFGTFGKTIKVLGRGEPPSLRPAPGQVGSEFLRNGSAREEWLSYFDRIPRWDEMRSRSHSAAALSYVTCKIGSEIRSLAIVTGANSTLWDCIRGGRALPPVLVGDSMGQYKSDDDEGFYVNDLERGSTYLSCALSQKESDETLKVPRDTWVSLSMVDEEMYKLGDVGAPCRIIQSLSLGSSRRVNNPKNVEELKRGKASKVFVVGEDNLTEIGRHRAVEYGI